jgi:CheY-like chemotaxis protein
MTANAMVGDREKVLRGGMNDHIAKPIRSTRPSRRLHAGHAPECVAPG